MTKLELTEILEKQRQVYLRQLDEFWKKRNEGRELLIAYNSETPTTLLNLTRFDYIDKNNGKFIIEELWPDTYVSHQRIEFIIETLTVELNPFYWHGCEFILDKKITSFSFIEVWAKQWLDQEGWLQENVDSYSNAIHSVTIPEVLECETRFSIDFGTAPLECFFHLLDKFAEEGIKKVIIHSFDLMK